MVFKTQKQIEVEKRRLAVYTDFKRLYEKGGMKTVIYDHLAKKYGIHRSYVARIVRHMKKGEKIL